MLFKFDILFFTWFFGRTMTVPYRERDHTVTIS